MIPELKNIVYHICCSTNLHDCIKIYGNVIEIIQAYPKLNLNEAFIIASRVKGLKLMKWIHRQGPYIQTSGVKALEQAISNANLEIVKWLWRNGY